MVNWSWAHQLKFPLSTGSRCELYPRHAEALALCLHGVRCGLCGVTAGKGSWGNVFLTLSHQWFTKTWASHFLKMFCLFSYLFPPSCSHLLGNLGVANTQTKCNGKSSKVLHSVAFLSYTDHGYGKREFLSPLNLPAFLLGLFIFLFNPLLTVQSPQPWFNLNHLRPATSRHVSHVYH